MLVFGVVLLVFAFRLVVVLGLSAALASVSAVALAFCVGVFLRVRFLPVRLRSIWVCTSLRGICSVRVVF